MTAALRAEYHSGNMFSRVLLWLCFIGLTPAGPELVEWTTHYVQEGDFADATNHRRAPAQDSEHGCAVLCHACACHGPSAAPRYTRQTPGAAPLLSRVIWPQTGMHSLRDTPQPPTPPPNG